MTQLAKITDSDLQEYLDDRLAGDRLDQVDTYLRANPVKAAAVETMARHGETLRKLGSGVLDEAIPKRLTDILKTPVPKTGTQAAPISRTPWSRIPEAVAACLILVIGLGLGWGANEYAQPKPPDEWDLILPEAANAFSFFSSGKSYDNFFAPDRYGDFETASKDIFSRAIPLPDFSHVGYQYAGARIAPAMNRNVGYLFYQTSDGDRVSLVFWRSSMAPDRIPVSRSLGDIAARAWSEDGFGFAILGNDRDGILDKVTNSAISYFESAFTPQ